MIRRALLAALLAIAAATPAIALSPMLANNTFAGGSFASWNADTDTGCTINASPFAGVNAADQDGDSGYASFHSGNCASASTGGLNQTFSIAGTPTGQSYSFWYNAPTATDPYGCGLTTSASNLTLTINGTTIANYPTPSSAGWTRVTGSTTALHSGSNTIDISASGTSFHNVNASCASATGFTYQTIEIDDVVLSASIAGNSSQWFGAWK